MSLVGVISVSLANINHLRHEASNWREQALLNSELVQEQEGIVSKKAIENENLKTDIKELNNILKDRSEIIRNLTKINVSLLDSIGIISTSAYIETLFVPIEFSDSLRYFLHESPNLTLEGVFEIVKPYRLNINKFKATFDLTLSMTQSKDKSWNTYIVPTNSNLFINSIYTQVNPYEPSFFEKLSFSAGLYGGLNQVGALFGINYDKHQVAFLFNNYGGSVGYVRTFKINP
jgi:hypothetical protein